MFRRPQLYGAFLYDRDGTWAAVAGPRPRIPAWGPALGRDRIQAPHGRYSLALALPLTMEWSRDHARQCLVLHRAQPLPDRRRPGHPGSPLLARRPLPLLRPEWRRRARQLTEWSQHRG